MSLYRYRHFYFIGVFALLLTYSRKEKRKVLMGAVHIGHVALVQMRVSVTHVPVNSVTSATSAIMEEWLETRSVISFWCVVVVR